MLRCIIILSSALIGSMALSAQEVERSVVSTAGGSVSVGAVRMDQTIGEPAVTTVLNAGVLLSQGFEQAEPLRLRLGLRALLQGPYDPNTGRMHDALRAAGVLPMTEPYTALGFVQVGSGGERTNANVLAVSGDHAIVDWVLIELRSGTDNTVVSATRAALLCANGDVVDVNGSSSVAFDAPSGSYYICLRHRNHLAVLTEAPVVLGPTVTGVDLTDGSMPTFGSEAQTIQAGARLLWSGDVNTDGTIKYTGSGNDRDVVLVAIGGSVPTNTITGYHLEDTDLDGTVKYTGIGNDRDPMLVNIGGTVPTNVRHAQLP